jgi:hypothetical protein
MPYEEVDAELFLEHQGVKIYHIYRDNVIDEGKHKLWFGLTPRCGEGDREMFDVRDLARQLDVPEPQSELDTVVIISQAINEGILTA